MKRAAPSMHLRDGLARFALMCILLSIAAHAAAYLIHEYAHSVLAWSLGWMSSPFGIDYGSPTLSNVIFLGDVSDNVSYTPIFASGHRVAAAMIALAGTFLGNGLGYLLAMAAFYRLANRRWAALACFWFALMCAGNVWSYVPMRVFATHADMALAAQGLGLPGWGLLLCLLLPAGWIIWHFLARLFPAACLATTGHSTASRVTLIAMGAFWFFSFFVGDEQGGAYGSIAQVLSMLSGYALFPLYVAALSSATLREAVE
ncbi:hypothetical protein [Dyella mobilis]|uniref:Peptidase M50B-like n=1 Tax=Dyella mobilis TaxID=1849582 RepID=A0ABS2KEB2_9GAMM|nr:hypothetical protein [Dyella mobilis]MBM7129511.1 hypothetical protein [Dyella mobilis]GLQ98224.1 hypothetical protein GCM10007863_26440 [Dyella mobilis]